MSLEVGWNGRHGDPVVLEVDMLFEPEDGHLPTWHPVPALQ